VTDVLDLIVVGAGFGGHSMLYQARQCALRALVLEAGSGVGDVWHWNRYRGDEVAAAGYEGFTLA